jgi:hypothetical protein
MVQGQPEEEDHEPSILTTAGWGDSHCHPRYERHINRRIVIQANLGIKSETLSKNITSSKRGGGVAQVVSTYLPSMKS